MGFRAEPVVSENHITLVPQGLLIPKVSGNMCFRNPRFPGYFCLRNPSFLSKILKSSLFIIYMSTFCISIEYILRVHQKRSVFQQNHFSNIFPSFFFFWKLIISFHQLFNHFAERRMVFFLFFIDQRNESILVIFTVSVFIIVVIWLIVFWLFFHGKTHSCMPL